MQHVPVSFTRSYFGKKMQNVLNVELEVDDKIWLGTLVTSPNSAQTFFSAGWRAFARENHLQAGDSCYFELVNKERDPVLFKVTISRRTTTWSLSTKVLNLVLRACYVRITAKKNLYILLGKAIASQVFGPCKENRTNLMYFDCHI